MTPVKVLLVEDNEGDVILAQEIFEETEVPIAATVVRDGEEAIDFLTKQGEHSEAATPELIVLDINLPKVDGHEVLKYIKENETLEHIPVIMLSSSSSEKDLKRSQQNKADCYISKPVEANDFTRLVQTIKTFCMSILKKRSSK